MTPRLLADAKVRLAMVALLAGGSLLATTGCDPRTLAYFLQPFEPMVPPKCETSFEGKKVVVLSQVASELGVGVFVPRSRHHA